MGNTQKARPACGTYPGYQAHRRRGDEICVPCRDACADYHRDRRDRRPESLRREQDARKARRRALSRLAEQHQEQYRALYREEQDAIRAARMRDQDGGVTNA
jgi:hypothetical protein